MPGSSKDRFNFLLACEMAGFAFETYNAPTDARWEEGADGTRVAFKVGVIVCLCLPPKPRPNVGCLSLRSRTRLPHRATKDYYL